MHKLLTSAACRTWVNCHLFRAAQQKSRQFTQAATAGVTRLKEKYDRSIWNKRKVKPD